MYTVDELLKDPEVASFLEKHEGAAAERVYGAADYLKGYPDAPKALKKILSALDQGVLTVFFSYKKKDQETASKIIEILEPYAASKMDFKSMASFAVEGVGKPFYQKIHEAIQCANWFLLLLPDPNEKWDWCLFEAGLFAANVTSADRLICIHHPGIEIPDQFQGYQSVPATFEAMKGFLTTVYLEKNPIPGLAPLNDRIKPQIEEMAMKMVAAIKPPRNNRVHYVFPALIEVNVENSPALKDLDDLDKVSIISSNDEARQLFKFIASPKTFGELRSTVTELDSRWRTELLRTINDIAGNRMFEPIQAVFKAQSGKIYRPVTLAIDRLGAEDGPIEKFQIAFVEEVGAIDSSSLPKQMALLSSVLRFSFRYRWEVLEPFSKEGLVEDDVIKLESALHRLTADWASRGVKDISVMLKCFPDEDAKKITRIMEQWRLVRNTAGTGTLDVAIKERKASEIPKLLKSLIPLSQEFLELAADRFSEMVCVPCENTNSDE